MPGQDITEEYDTAKEYVREKFEENPDLAESDTTRAEERGRI